MEKKYQTPIKMNILITGAAGFIGFHTCLSQLKKKNNIIGIDNINSYYDVKLKKARLKILMESKSFTFIKSNIQNPKLISKLKKNKIDIIINLAAQAGVRHSLQDPYTYINSNILGQLNMLELAKKYNVRENSFMPVLRLFMVEIRQCLFQLITEL